ncbi:hypothetical protein HYALB_00012820 [Hymenoscyphus albidus]|uniref:Lysine-specific metallo-endopeptidase domain-containing protein n=1 Tax=Hymenoscyphus albidus TaxID=595503 RepID=A0A9N9LTV0_9HELO|nr:hypothetical protein HYALB_00012820 [Hymenoscyphus albidus]
MSFYFFRLILSYFLIFLTAEVHAFRPTERTLWFDKSCSSTVKNTVWKDVQDMIRVSNLTTHPDPNSDAGSLFRYVFRDNKESSYNFFEESIGAININVASSKKQANTFIYCDQDKRWHKPGKEPHFLAKWFLRKKKSKKVSQKVWYDAENHISWEPSSPLGIQAPACRPEAKSGAAGQTHCNVAHHGKTGDCAMSLCPTQIDRDQVAFSQTPKEENLAVKPGPGDINRYAFLSETLLHEIAHTLENEHTNSRWKDVKDGHRWKNVADPTRKAVMAQSDAENLAYWGLGNLIP